MASASHDSYYSPARRSAAAAGPKPPSSPPYAVDPAMAAAWSGQDPMELAKSWSADSGADRHEQPPASRRAKAGAGGRRPSPEDEEAGTRRGGGSRSPPPPPRLGGAGDRPHPRQPPHRADRPDLVKRGTSHQNETAETRPALQGPSVKKAALNRDNSLASNRLKEQYVPGYRRGHRQGGTGGGGFNEEQAMTQLTENMEMSTLDAPAGGTAPAVVGAAKAKRGRRRRPSHPRAVGGGDRVSTVDQIAMDLFVRPVVLTASARSSTIEALALDLEDDPWVRPDPVQRGRTMEEVFNELRGGDAISRPSSLKYADRLTTSELLDIVNEPLVDDDDDDDANSGMSWRGDG
jgi:hypothetical protein